jgi:RimJ/RimL family protein N-acetyltransferase
MLKLRPFKADDAEIISSWLKDERSFYFWCAGRYTYPLSAIDLTARYQKSNGSNELIPLTLVDDDRVVGHLTLRVLDGGKNLRLGFVVVDDALRGKGYGKSIILSALEYAKNNLHAQKATICVFENNLPALNCYKSVGFLPTEEVEIFNFFGEEWKCRQLEKLF